MSIFPILQYHQERDKSYDEICGPIAEKCMFIFYCLSPAYQNRDRLSQLKRWDEDVSRWKDMAVRVSEILGDRWHVDSWNAAGKKKASATTETEHQNQQFHSVVIRQFLDFVCDDSINLDIFRKCFLYQVCS